MVKRFLSVIFVIILFFSFCIPSFAADVVQTEADLFGFAYDNSKILFGTKYFTGDMLNRDTQFTEVERIYLYIPCSTAPNKLDFRVTFCCTDLSLNLTACDYGLVYSNNYHIDSSLTLPNWDYLGGYYPPGTSARYVTFQITFNDLPFTSVASFRYIRVTLDVNKSSINKVKLVNFLQADLSQNLSGVLGNPSYTFDGVNSIAYGRTTSGSLSSDGYYITGSKKYKYYNGSSVVTDTLNLNNGTSGSGGYLHVPSHNIVSDASHQLSFTINASTLSGTLTPSFSSQSTDLQGTYLARNAVNTLTMTATRSYDDSELIDAVNDASDRNHADLGRIESQMQEVVDHMQGLEQQGNEINGTTSQSTINNASGVVNTGTSSMSDTANYVSSGVTAGSAESQGYVQLLGYGVGEIVNFGSSSTPLGIWIWAIIFIPVAFFIFRRVSE